MKKEPKIIIIDAEEGKAAALTHQILMKEKFGDDIILVTPKEAKEQGLNLDVNPPPIKITAPPVF